MTKETESLFMVTLKDMTKEELIKLVSNLRGASTKLRNSAITKQQKLRRYEARFRKIRNEIDYLLEHPYSRDSAYNTRPHKRQPKNPSRRVLRTRKRPNEI